MRKKCVFPYLKTGTNELIIIISNGRDELFYDVTLGRGFANSIGPSKKNSLEKPDLSKNKQKEDYGREWIINLQNSTAESCNLSLSALYISYLESSLRDLNPGLYQLSLKFLHLLHFLSHGGSVLILFVGQPAVHLARKGD